MTIKKGDRVRLLRDVGDPKYGKKGEIGTVAEVDGDYFNVSGIGRSVPNWTHLGLLELVADPATTTLAQAHAAGLLAAWMGEALDPCVPCDDEALVVRTTWDNVPVILGRGHGDSVVKPLFRHAVKIISDGDWILYGEDGVYIGRAVTEAQALAWCARGVRPDEGGVR